MKPEIKEKWLNNLQSGKYIPAEGNLRMEEGGEVRHCCLGVLGEMAVEAGVVPDLAAARAKSGAEFLGKKVCDWAGLSASTRHDSAQATLASYNDEAFQTPGVVDLNYYPPRLTAYPQPLIEYIKERL